MARGSTSDPTLAPLLRSSSGASGASVASSASTLDGASSRGSVQPASVDPRVRRKTRILRAISFISAIFSALGVGSFAVFSLYGPLFQSRLRFTQFEVNGIASTMSLSMYIPLPVLGYMCDRVGPGALSFVSVVLGGGGWALAAALYRKGEAASNAGDRSSTVFPPMLLAFVLIGTGTAAMYLSSLTTCGKNFGKSKHRGVMLVVPIACIGLSGMLISQIGSDILVERRPDGSKGDVDVFRFFLFLGGYVVCAGLIGTFALRVVEEEELIDEAVEELERSGFLDGSEIMHHQHQNYDTMTSGVEESNVQLTGTIKDDHEADDAKFKKTFILNAETRKFVTDETTWWFALGFWLIIGPGEAFINNFGTVLGTLYPPGSSDKMTSAATHVSIVAATSTVGRLLAGSLSDLLAPSPQGADTQSGVESRLLPKQKHSVSRVTLLLVAGFTMSVGTLFLASGFVQGHGGRFWVVSGCIGAGYGATFSLTPIIVSIFGGISNFGTNFGIIALFPALGACLWNTIFAAVYQAGTNSSSTLEGPDDDVFCYGKHCYSSTFWWMTFSIWFGGLMVLRAWKGRDGWTQRGIVL